MIHRRLSLIGCAMTLAACAASTLPYTPVEQPSATPISADYRLLDDRLRVEIDTGGFRVEDARILTMDGRDVLPQAIEDPWRGRGSRVGFGISLGGGWSSGGGGHFGTGLAVGTGFGGGRAARRTVVFFALDQVGPAPWRVRLKVVGLQPVDILVGPDREIPGPVSW